MNTVNFGDMEKKELEFKDILFLSVLIIPFVILMLFAN